MPNRSELRRRIRETRRNLSQAQRRAYAQRMASHLCSHPSFLNSQRIACYIAVDGEMDPTPLLTRAWKMGKSIYLPVLVPFCENRLWFAPYQPGCKMRLNRFGIPEPVSSRRHMIKATDLDLVLTPLVAFDTYGNRLGMGGGYYDRTFAFLRRRQHWKKPHLLGVAYELQKVETLTPQPWDVSLYGIVTETALHLNRK